MTMEFFRPAGADGCALHGSADRAAAGRQCRHGFFSDRRANRGTHRCPDGRANGGACARAVNRRPREPDPSADGGAITQSNKTTDSPPDQEALSPPNQEALSPPKQTAPHEKAYEEGVGACHKEEAHKSIGSKKATDKEAHTEAPAAAAQGRPLSSWPRIADKYMAVPGLQARPFFEMRHATLACASRSVDMGAGDKLETNF